MDYKAFQKNLGKMGAFLKNIKPGDACPPDDLLFEYVYGDLSEAERTEVAEHTKGCVRCRFEVMRMETERTAWKGSLEKDPDAALARLVGREGLKRAQEIIARETGIFAPPPAMLAGSLGEKYRSRIEAGWEKFRAVVEMAQEWSLKAGVPLLVGRGGPSAGAREPRFTYALEDGPPEMPVTAPETARYHSLLMIRPDRNDVVVLYENRKILQPLHITPVFSEDDIGIDQLFLIYSTGPLAISENEVEIGPGRFAEIISQAEEDNAQVATFTIEVKKKD